MTRQSYNLELIEGLIKIRNRPELVEGSGFTRNTRDWLRQCIQTEKQRRGR